MGLTTQDVEILRNDKMGPKLAEALKKRRFEAWYFSKKEDALKHLEGLIPKNHVVSWGGSLTMETLGVQNLMKEKYSVIDRDAAANAEEKNDLMRKALTCDTYLSGVNAISEAGELILIDGVGNRCAAVLYGPKQVIIFAGMNKVVKTLKDAYQRARNIASPKNTQRFPDKNTPCSKTGMCGDCAGQDCLCSYIVTVRGTLPAGRIKILLINENLGL